MHVAAAEAENVPPIPVGLEFEHGKEVLLGGEVDQPSPICHRLEHGGDSWGGENGWGGRDGWAGGYNDDDPIPKPAFGERSPPPMVLQRVQRHDRVPTLDIGYSDSSKEEMEEGVENINSVRHMYHDETWTKQNFAFGPPMEFTRVGGPK